MMYFIIRLGIYTFASAVVMSVVPGLSIAPNPYLGQPLTSIVVFLAIGLVFQLLHFIVRPVLLFLTGRIYIWSMGLIALVIDTFIFLLLTYIAPTVWEVGGARLLSAILGAMLMGVFVISLEALFGFDSPRLDQARKTAFYWRWLNILPTGRRNRLVENLRTQQIINTIQSYAIDILIGFTPFSGFRKAMQRMLYSERPRLIESDPAVKLRLMLQELGPTFVKFGQMAAGRIEILPPAWQIELEKLQDDVQPFAYAEVEEAIRRELGGTPEVIFASFDPIPLAAASTGQVHAATLSDGAEVVVKVRRPNVEITVRGDLSVMQDTINMAERRLSWLRRFGLGELFREFAENVLTELDYRNESYHGRLLRHNMERLPYIHVPMIYTTYSTARVITQERVAGVKITDTAALDAAGIDREELALNFFRALLQQLLFDGFFHADPHPGNVWANPQTGRVIFLDLGMMGRLSLGDRFTLGRLIWALQERDARMTEQVFVAMCRPHRGYDSAALVNDLERLINRYLVMADSPTDMTRVISEMVGILIRHGLRLRKEFTLAFKAIGQGEAIMRALMGEKSLDAILDITYSMMRESLLARIDRQNIIGDLGKPLAREVATRLPEMLAATSVLLDDFQHGRSLLQLDLDKVDERVNALQSDLRQGMRQVVLSVLLVGLLLGSTLILLAPFESKVSEAEALAIRLTAVTGFIVSVSFILIFLLSALRQSSRRRDADGARAN